MIAILIIGGRSLWLLAHCVLGFLEPGAYEFDSTLYWAMGRSILNGLAPYIDIFDNKPPGIYFLSAISLWIFEDGKLGHYLGAISLLTLPMLSIAFVWKTKKRESLSRDATLLLTALALALAVSWISFQAEFGRPWQTEQFAALFATCYAFCMVTMNKTKLRTILLALFLMISIGFKEPFLISCLAAAILYDFRLKTITSIFFIPLAIAIVLGSIILGVTGTLLPYLTIDLPTVLGHRVTGFEAPFFIRIVSVHRPLAQFAQISSLLPVVAIFLPAVYVIATWKPKQRPTNYTRPIVFAVFIILLGTFSIGIGGDFQNHHYAVPAPLVATIIFLTLSTIAQQWDRFNIRLLAIGLLILSGASLIQTSSYNTKSLIEKEQSLRIAAAGVDTVLDRCDIDRYYYIHRTNEMRLDGFTTHSPMNHSLFYPIDQASQNGPGFQKTEVDRISQSKIIVMPNEGFTATNDLGESLFKYILSAFSKDPPSCAKSIPEIPGFFLLFRQNNSVLHYEE